MTAYEQRKIKKLEAENAKLGKTIARLKKQLKVAKSKQGYTPSGRTYIPYGR